MSMSPPESPDTRPARSADDIRAWIVAELSRSLNVAPETIDTAAPLDSLGVDSLAAIGMTGGLAGWLDRDLPTTLLWDYASIDALAEDMADPKSSANTRPWPGILELQPHGDRVPVFYFPGKGGHPHSFGPLAAHLDATQPCYGLIVPGLNAEATPFTRVEQIAAAMLENVRRVQPSGPYQFAGYSFGGLVAFEAAQQLVAAGETVSMLAMYDTFAPAARATRPRWQRLALHAYVLTTRPGRLQYVRGRLKRLGARVKTQLGQPATAAAAAPVAPDVAPAAVDEADEKHGIVKLVMSANDEAAASYQPRPYPGSMVLFRAADLPVRDLFYKIDKTIGWAALVRGGVRVIELPGTHRNLLDASHAPAAAERLRPYLCGRQAF